MNTQPTQASPEQVLPKDILISTKNICVKRQGKTILDRVSLDIHRAKIITLIGPNGAGKSTLIKSILNIIKVDSGEILHKSSLKIGYMPQKTHLNYFLPINVNDFLLLSDKVDNNDIKNALSMVKGIHLVKKSMKLLSGGEFQRVMLARAILRKPDLLVLDEPTQGIDINGQQELYHLLGDIRNSLNSAILMVSHDLHLVMSSTDHVICLNRHICCSGRPESVSNDPAYLQLFGLKDSKDFAVYEHHHDHHHGTSGEVISHD